MLFQVAAVFARYGKFTVEPYSDLENGLHISNIALWAYAVTGGSCFLAVEGFFLLSLQTCCMASRLTGVFDHLADVTAEHRPKLGKDTLRSYMKLVVILLLLGVVILTVYPLMGNEVYGVFFEPLFPGPLYRFTFVIWFTISNIFSYWGPPLVGVMSLLVFMVECCSECYEIVASLARSEEKSLCSGAVVTKEKKSVELGQKVTRMVKDLDTAISSFMVVTYFVVLIVLTSNLYCLLDLFFEDWSRMKTLFLVRLLAENFAYLTAVALTSHCGQRLEDRRFRAKEALEDLYKAFGKDEDAAMCREMGVLLSRMSAEGPLSPHAFFTVNHRGLLGIVGTVVTYIIVLLQFRTSDLN